MKKIFLLIILSIALSSCESGKPYKMVTVITDVHITGVNVYKYSKVQGYIYYNNIRLDIDNGNTGYYYKKYRLKPGDVMKRIVTVYYYINYDNNPYKNGVILSTGEVNFTDFEVH